MRRTKVAQADRKTGYLRAVQLLVGHTKMDSTVHYLDVDLDTTLDYDADLKSLKLDWRLAGAEMGELSSSLRLGQVEPRLVEKIELYQAAMARTGSPNERQALLNRPITENMPLLQNVALQT